MNNNDRSGKRPLLFLILEILFQIDWLLPLEIHGFYSMIFIHHDQVFYCFSFFFDACDFLIGRYLVIFISTDEVGA
jgi:hypothetical protein